MTDRVGVCTDPVVEVVHTAPGSTATEVAGILEINRRDAVHLLNDHFGECLYQDNRYRWWPAERDIPDADVEQRFQTGESDLGEGVDHRKLTSYYLEAVIADSRDNVSVFAKSSDPDYVTVDPHPVATGTYAIPRDGYAAFANNAHGQNKRLAIGSPVYADYITSKKGWSGFLLKPLFTWTIQPGSGEIEVVRASIAVNADVLAALAGQKRADPEQVVSLQTNLGLDRPDELPEFDEVMARLVSLYPGWRWAEPMDPDVLGTLPRLDQLNSRDEEGLYNRIILTSVDGPT